MYVYIYTYGVIRSSHYKKITTSKASKRPQTSSKARPLHKQSEQTAAAACDRCGEKKMEMVMFQQGAVKLLCSVAM